MLKSLLGAAVLAVASVPALAIGVGQAVPDLTVTDTGGRNHKLSDFKGKTVVLEWTNPNCPFVKKHYGTKNMQALQKDYTGRQVVWLSVNSTHKGHVDYQEPTKMAAWVSAQGASPTAAIMDTSGEAGKRFNAKTTPHMFVVDSKGTLAYAGAIDDKTSADPADVKGASNYVRAALDELLAGKPVSKASTAPYGCSVKYAE